MEIFTFKNLLGFLLLVLVSVVQVQALTKTCLDRKSPCFRKLSTCPAECPTSVPKNPKQKVCVLNCLNPICKTECRRIKPGCQGPGAACFDPRFIGADGVVFYFHGESNKHFALVTDPKLQINARFIGHRPVGRTRDYTWIQALGILFGSHTFTLEATKASVWDDQVDLLKFTYNGNQLLLAENQLSVWQSEDNAITVARTSNKNSVLVTILGIADVSVNVVPITKHDDKIHNYQLPSDDCFAHLDVQFRFYSLSTKVEGVLGRTYQPDFDNPVKHGVAMPMLGGEEMYNTTSLLSADCGRCIFSSTEFPVNEPLAIRQVVDE